MKSVWKLRKSNGGSGEVPSSPLQFLSSPSSERNAWSSVTLQLEILPLGVNIILCAESFVMQCVAVKSQRYWWLALLSASCLLWYSFEMDTCERKNKHYNEFHLSLFISGDDCAIFPPKSFMMSLWHACDMVRWRFHKETVKLKSLTVKLLFSTTSSHLCS